jgi:hypothetical protein
MTLKRVFFEKQSTLPAIGLAQRVVELDPNYAPAPSEAFVTVGIGG